MKRTLFSKKKVCQNEKIKIAYISKKLIFNGISSVIMNYCENIDKDKFEITLFAGDPVDDKLLLNCNKNNINFIKTPSKEIKNFFKYYFCLFKELDGKNYDIVHIHGNSAVIALELLIAKIKGIKVVIPHCHSISCNQKKAHYILKPFLNKIYTKAFACSNAAGHWLFDNNNFEVLPNGFVTSKFKFNESERIRIRKDLKIENNFVIGHVGLFNDTKNHPFILEVFEMVARKNENAFLLLVGAGPNYDKIQSLIEKHPYKNNIICYGETAEVEKVYNAMDAFIFPSKFEGLGIVLLEAQISGLSCVASDTVPKEVTLNDKTVRFLSLDDDKIKWRDSLLDINTRQNRKLFYDKNINFIKKYEIKENVKMLEKIYIDLIQKEQ